MSEKKKKKYGRIAKITGVIIGLVLVLGVSYAVFRTISKGEKTNRINTADFGVIIDDASATGIEITNAEPVLSGEGQKQDPYTFSVVNNGSVAANYKLYLEATSTSDLPSNKIKYNLIRSDIKQILTYLGNPLENIEETVEPIIGASDEDVIAYQNSSLLSRVDVVDEDGKKLYVLDLGTIGPKQRQSYELKMWIAYAAGTEIINKNFEAKVRVDAEQTSENDVYSIEQYDITGDSDAKTLGYHTYIGLYSDGSIRFSGVGEVSSSYDETVEVMTLGFDKKDLLEKVNSVLRKHQEQEYDDINTLFQALLEEGKYDDTIVEEILAAMNQSKNLFNGSIYFDDGINLLDGNGGNIFSNLLMSDFIEKVYISTTVQEIKGQAFNNVPNLKEIYFVDIKDSTKAFLKSEGLRISSYTFSGNKLTKIEFKNNLKSLPVSSIDNCPNLTTLTLPTSITSINYKAIQNCSNLDLKILAKKSEVRVVDNSYHDTSLNLGVKSVTWVNG